MAPKPVFLLLLWGLTLFAHGVTSLCNATCSTDYTASVSCSCLDSVLIDPVHLEVRCSDDELEATGSCDIKPPDSGCTMLLQKLDDVASVGTMCNVTVSQLGTQSITSVRESASWMLSDVVKPPPPFNIQVAHTDDFYNITWNNNNNRDCLTHRVRIREGGVLSKDPARSFLSEEQYMLIDQSKLQPHVKYIVDVQAKMCPENVYQGPWSDWSSAAEWRTTGASAETGGINGYWWYVSLPIILILGLLLLGYLQKPCWQKKLELITYIPKPNEFFKPLYHNYGGNFKEWVKPPFDEYDYLRISSNSTKCCLRSEKQHDVLDWNNEKQSYSEDNETKHFLHMLQPPSNLLLHFQDGGSSQGTGHSTGRISIHTVTLSGEGEEVPSQSSINTLRSYQDGQSYGSFEEDTRDLEQPQMSRMDRQSGASAQHENQIPNDLLVENINFEPRAQFDEPERESLNSFGSGEHSEDGYPHVDLDTVDSGFGECGSPGASDSNTAERTDSDLFRDHKNSNSNYVKQWMICSTIQEDSDNLESELHETD